MACVDLQVAKLTSLLSHYELPNNFDVVVSFQIGNSQRHLRLGGAVPYLRREQRVCGGHVHRSRNGGGEPREITFIHWWLVSRTDENYLTAPQFSFGGLHSGESITREFYDAARRLTQKYQSVLLVDSIQAGVRCTGALSIVDYPGFQGADSPDLEVFSKAVNAGIYV